MPRGFLPPASPGTSYPIVTPPPADFAEGDAALLSQVGSNMAVAEAQTEGRVPSPLSRAYMFYTALFGRSLAMTGNDPGAPAAGAAAGAAADADRLATEGRRALQTRARATFRGLCAAFALRDALGLEIALRRVPLVADDRGLARVLLPNLRTGPGGAAYWQAVRLFTVRAPADAASRPEVLAGLSPLTGLFPAARPPGRALAGVFWYDPATGAWRDPTGPDPTGTDSPLSSQTSAAVRGALAAWLQSVRASFATGSLAAVGLDARREGLVRAELDAWANELTGVAHGDVRVVAGSVASEGGEPVPAFLLPTCQGVAPAVLSDLGQHQGRLVVTSTGLRDRTRRVWGRLAGHPDLGARVATLPVSGDNLGAALGLGATAAPTKFVVVDKLFTPKLSFLTQKGLSDEWRALEVSNHGSIEHALLPFAPEILELLDPLDLAASARGELSQDMHHYIVRLTVGGSEVVQLYSTSGEGPYAVDSAVLADTVDLRVFPNFDLDPVRSVLTKPDGTAPDATYYARARLSPTWDFGVTAVRLDRTEGQRRVAPTGTVERRGSLHATEPGAYPPGQADFFTLPDKPDAFSFGGRGLCVLALRPPGRTPAAGLNAQDWEIAVDFGTSNTCVATRAADGTGTAAPLTFPVFTTTLLKTPTYTALEPVNEGAAATIDFFYKLSDADQRLTPYPYFPTQVFTQQKQLPGTPDGVLDLSAGLIYFLTPSLGTGLQALRLTEGFDVPGDARPLSKRFRLETDIKWTRREWMGAFMEHLRKQVALSAAYQFARVKKASFSFPKAFSRADESNYEMVLSRVWGSEVVQPLLSESEAVRNTLAGQANPHVVFDIGGGTTDVIGFNGQRPAFQTSFRLAGGQITTYVHASPLFRKALADVVDIIRPGAYAVTLDMLGGAGPAQVSSAWTGLLQVLDDDDPSGRLLANVFLNLAESGRADDDAGRAIRGFFLTNVLLFGGLGFYAGRLLAAASAGAIPDGAGPFPLGDTSITLTGNGSKLFRAVSSERSPFDPVFEALFRLGLGSATQPARVHFNGIYTLPDGTVAPKTTVALGLLSAGNSGGAAIPVANIVGETVGDETFASPLVPFYARIRRGEPFVAPSTPPAELAAFLGALSEHLPRGERNGYPVVPGVGRDWHLGIMDTLYPRSVGALQERLAATAAGLPDSDDDVAVTSAMEPLFVAELGALVDQVREDYAGSPR